MISVSEFKDMIKKGHSCTGMKKGNIQNKTLYNDFYEYLVKKYGEVEKEALFSKFMPTTRKFRADFLLSIPKIIIEINGGSFSNPVVCNRCGNTVRDKKGNVVMAGGRHNRGAGYKSDLQKLNLAQLNGYKVFQFTYEDLKNANYIEFI